MYLKYALLVLCNLIAGFCNFFLAPIVVLFASDDGWLPRWLWWFQTPDNSLDGDSGWINEHRRFKVEDKPWKRWYNRTTWLYRNATYGFCIDVLGAKCYATDVIKVVGDPKVSNRPIKSGLVKRYLYRNGEVIYFQWYYVRQWSDSRCIRINLGWKLWGDATKDRNCQLVFSPNPAMGIGTK